MAEAAKACKRCKLSLDPSKPEVYCNECWEIQLLLAEVDCRIEHGADSGGHLEYVKGKLLAIMREE